MSNKRGGIGGKLLLVLILMMASAVGGAYAYSILDGKMAVSDAEKVIDRISVSDYDTAEAETIEGYIEQAKKDLETAKSRKEVYEITDRFKTDVSKVMTKSEKELEAARKELEEARKNSAASDTQSGTDTSQSGNNFGADDSGESSKGSGIFNNIFGNKDDESEADDYSGSQGSDSEY